LWAQAPHLRQVQGHAALRLGR